MLHMHSPFWAAGGALVGALAGVLGSLWWARRAAKQRRRIPKHWPLDSRRIANSAECQVWHWLNRVFFDHHVTIKAPVTRFTMPRTKQESAHWYQLLSGLYCTFTVCTSDGHVVGCVDVLRPNGISRSNRRLKLTLLSQCDIAYWVVDPGHLPALSDIRTEFLGDNALMPTHKGTEQAVSAAQQELRAAVVRMRRQRLADLAQREPAGAAQSTCGPETVFSDSEFRAGAIEQPNSFIAPLDSRPVKLR